MINDRMLSYSYPLHVYSLFGYSVIRLFGFRLFGCSVIRLFVYSVIRLCVLYTFVSLSSREIPFADIF